MWLKRGKALGTAKGYGLTVKLQTHGGLGAYVMILPSDHVSSCPAHPLDCTPLDLAGVEQGGWKLLGVALQGV